VTTLPIPSSTRLRFHRIARINLKGRPTLSTLLTGLFFFTIMSSSPAQTVVPTVPMLPNFAPALNGTIQPQEWKDALVLKASGEEAGPATEFRLVHNGRALWVAVDCEEPRPEGPSAHRRGTEDILTVDDAVEVALGLRGQSARTLTMGGYEGASAGAVAPLEHLYEFIVNAAGSTSRRYDEAALPHPRFEAKVGKRKGGWSVELCIPFESLGVQDPRGQELYANFVRFRFPGKLAWRSMVAWGGYTPFPVALVRLAASPSEPRVMDTEVRTPSQRKRVGQREANTVKPSLEYFPLSHTLVGELTLKAGEKAILQTGEFRKETTALKSGLTKLELELPQPLAVGAQIEAKLNADGGTSLKREFTGSAVPAWAGSDAGLEYAKDVVPPPWYKPVVNGKAVKLTHANLIFGDTALPSSIAGQGGEVLARPMDIHLMKSGKRLKVTWAEARFSWNGARPVIHSRGQFNGGATSIEIRTEVDFDGFMIVQLRLDGAVTAIDSVQLVCPLKKECAQYIVQGSVQSILPIDAGGYKGAGGPRFWLGSETGGLAVATDLSFYQAEDRQHDIVIREQGNERELTVRPIDRAAQLPSGKVLQFYLQPTPVRTPSKTTTDDYNLWFESWSDYQGYPDLAKMDQVKERSKTSHAEGRKQLVYFNQLLSEDAPGFKEHKEELMAPPERMWYQRAYDPGKGVPCYVCCVRGPYGDLLLDGIRKLATEGDIDGIYMDGTSVDWDCDNPAHAACTTKRAAVWDEPGLTRITGTRTFLKRLRGIFAAKGRPLTLAAHTGGALDIHTLGLTDFFWEGEQLARYLPQYRIPRYEYAIGYSGTPWGYRTLFHDHWLHGRGKNWSLAYALLFNTDNYGGSARGDARPLMRPFDGEDAQFHPYWNGGQRLLKKSKTEKTSVSYYTSSQGAMVVATNFSFMPDEVELVVAELGIQPDDTWVDILTDQPHRVQNGRIHLTIPPYQGVALRPKQEAPTPAPLPLGPPPNVPELEGMDATHWKVNEEGSGVRREDILATATEAAKLNLHSVQYGAEAAAWIEGSALGPEATVHLKLKSEKSLALRIEFGAATLLCLGGNWTLEAPTDGWNDQRLQQVPWPAQRENDIELTLSNKELTVLINGQPMAKRMLLRPELAPARPLRIVTWGGDGVAIQLVLLTGKPETKTVPETTHPINP
jgi:hypothetical protein